MRLALKQLGSNQKELARRVGVSPTQISKWKKGEHMSHDMEERFREITGVGDKMPSFVLSAGSIEEADKWERFILYLAELAFDSAETGYNTAPLQDEPHLLCWHVFYVLEKMGATIPTRFPAELDANYDDDETDAGAEAFFDAIDKNPHGRLIQNVFEALNNVYGFYAAYIREIVDDESLDLLETGMELESCLMELAACKIDVDLAFAPKFNEFRHETVKNYARWLNAIKDKAFRAGIPLRAELLDTFVIAAESRWDESILPAPRSQPTARRD